jgi:hypothetical protein
MNIELTMATPLDFMQFGFHKECLSELNAEWQDSFVSYRLCWEEGKPFAIYKHSSKVDGELEPEHPTKKECVFVTDAK